jgi:hypothetical protein
VYSRLNVQQHCVVAVELLVASKLLLRTAATHRCCYAVTVTDTATATAMLLPLLCCLYCYAAAILLLLLQTAATHLQYAFLLQKYDEQRLRGSVNMWILLALFVAAILLLQPAAS